MGTEHSQKGFEECILFLSPPSSNGVRLLLYDNVDGPQTKLSSLLPRGSSCAIAITSRNHLLGVQYPDAHLRLDVMSPEEAVELLLYRSNRATITEQDRKDAASLAQALGYLPIALQQARSYMQQTQCTISAYLERLSNSRSRLLGQGISFQMDMDYISTYAAFETSFGGLALRVQTFLRLLSYFHWSNFPLELIMLAAKHQFSEYQWTYVDHDDNFYAGKTMLEGIFLCDGEWDVTNLDEMMVSLQNYSLITILPGVGTTLLQMHPLVHEWLQSCIPREERTGYQLAASTLLALGARDAYTATMQYLGSHVTHMSPLWNDLDVNTVAAFGDIMSKDGVIQGALELQERVVRDLRRQLDPSNIGLSNSILKLALAYRNSGRFKDAEKLQEEMAKLRREVLGEQHPDTITASHQLAGTYYMLGRLKDAEMLQEQVLTLRKKILGERHPDTIAASNNLAITYHDLGRLHDAEVLQEEVLKLRKEILGERHPHTIGALNNLAKAYRVLGRLHDAEVLQEEVLKLRKEILGERHPDTISASSSLAVTYYDLGRLHDAEMLEEEVLKLRKEILGDRHPDTIRASHSLAITYGELGRLQESEMLEEEALRLTKEVLGDKHPDTIRLMLNLAGTYISRNRNNAALELLDTAEGIIAETLGVAHPEYLRCQQIKSNAKRQPDASRKPWYKRLTSRRYFSKSEKDLKD